MNEGSGAPTGARVLRHPLLWAGPSRSPRASPRGSAFAIRAAGGRSPLGAPLWRFFGPEPARITSLWTLPSAAVSSGFHRLHSQVPLVVAGGRCCSGASREHDYEPCTQDAASRSDSGSSPETPSVSGTDLT